MNVRFGELVSTSKFIDDLIKTLNETLFPLIVTELESRIMLEDWDETLAELKKVVLRLNEVIHNPSEALNLTDNHLAQDIIQNILTYYQSTFSELQNLLLDYSLDIQEIKNLLDVSLNKYDQMLQFTSNYKKELPEKERIEQDPSRGLKDIPTHPILQDHEGVLPLIMEFLPFCEKMLLKNTSPSFGKAITNSKINEHFVPFARLHAYGTLFVNRRYLSENGNPPNEHQFFERLRNTNATLNRLKFKSYKIRPYDVPLAAMYGFATYLLSQHSDNTIAIVLASLMLAVIPLHVRSYRAPFVNNYEIEVAEQKFLRATP